MLYKTARIPFNKRWTPAPQLAKSRRKIKPYQRLLDWPDKNKLLKELPDLHEEAFNQVNCLDCAACCKIIRPGLKRRTLKGFPATCMKEGTFIDSYPEGLTKKVIMC